MPSGWFSSQLPFTGHPFVLAAVRILRLGVVGQVQFLVDTGCSVTTLHPLDSLDMDVDFGRMTQAGLVMGVGGNEPQFTEDAEISFIHGAQIVTYNMPIDIAPVLPHNRILPSLLGMDIIQHWRMVCDVQASELEFHVQQADDVREMNTP